jgi:predicted MFS family arabinose efflux permease
VNKFLGLGPTVRAFAHRNFALFFIGQGLSLSGTWMQSVAQSWLVYRLTGSPLLLGLVAFASQAPVLGLGLFGGVAADRWPRHRLLVLTQSLSLVQAAILTGLTLSQRISVHWILALAVILGLINAIDMPVRQSFIAELVPRQDLPSAIGLNSSAFNAARIIGPSLAGVLVATVGEGMCFLINTLSFLAVIGCLLAMRLPPRPQSKLESAGTLLANGLRYARETPHVRAVLALIAGLSITAMPYTVLLPVFAAEVVHSGAKGFGALMAATGVGALAGALRIARRATIRGLGTLIVQSVVVFGASLVLLAASRTLGISMLVLFAAGYGMISAMAGCNTLLQSLVPDDLRGRVMSLYTFFFLGMAPIGSLIAGVMATHLGTPVTFLAGGVGALLSAALFHHALPAIRRHIREHGLLPPEELVPH